MMVDADFPGGNILVDALDGDRLLVHQDLRDTEGDWFYWAFRVRGAAGRTLDVTFTGSDPFTSRGPAVSDDGGASWRWLGPVDGRRFTYHVPRGAEDVRFAMTIPYTQADLDAWLAPQDDVARGVLCTSRAGRPVELLRWSAPAPRGRVLLTARHHACETMASFVLEGFLAEAIAHPTVDVVAVPFVDKDGVEQGDQGKNRRPRDHNRDYDDQPLYPEVAAVMALDGPFDLALDLHCPWIRGEGNEHIYFVGGEDEANWRRVLRLAAALEAAEHGPLPYAASHGLPFGQGWNTAANYGGGVSFTTAARNLPGRPVSASLEFPYALVDGVETSPDSARRFGRGLARAVRDWLGDR
jgi:hypothetical protein